VFVYPGECLSIFIEIGSYFKAERKKISWHLFFLRRGGVYKQNEKKFSERRKHRAPAVVGGAKNFRPAADPFPGGAWRPKFNQLEMVTICPYRPSLVKIDARIFELSW